MQPRVLLSFSVVFILIALGLGAAIGYSISSERTSTLTMTETPSTSTMTFVYVESPTSGTESIIEVIILKTGTRGGGGYCQGSSVNTCVGFATTRYIFPLGSGPYTDATVTTSTSYGTNLHERDDKDDD